MTRDEWLGELQDYIRRMYDCAPDEVCKKFAGELFDLTADDDAPRDPDPDD